MKHLLITIIVILSIFSMTSCAQKIPSIQNKTYGILAIPIELQDTTDRVTEFTRSFVFYSTFDPEVRFSFTPSSGKQFAFSNGLPAGRYCLDKAIVKNRSISGYNDHINKEREISIQSSIFFTIESGKVTIADKKIVFRQFETGPGKFRVRYNVYDVANHEKKENVIAFNKIENSNQFELAK